MDARRLRRYVAIAVAVLVVLAVVNRVRKSDPPSIDTSPPALNTATTAYVPAVVRGDPLPTVTNIDGVSVARSGSTLRGFSLSAPGAQADDIMVVVLFAPEARMTLERTDGIKLYDPHAPTWLMMGGPLAALNAAMASMRYEPTRSGAQQLFVQVTNRSLGTNPRKLTVPVQVI